MTEFGPGCTFLIETLPGTGKMHFHIVISKPFTGDDGQERVLLVPVTSCRGLKSEDLTCVLKDKVHSFIQHDSLVLYETPRAFRTSSLITLQEEDPPPVVKKVKCREALTKRVIAGCFESERFPKKWQNLLAAQGLQPET